MTPDNPHDDLIRKDSEFIPAVQGLEPGKKLDTEDSRVQPSYEISDRERLEIVRLLIERKLSPVESRYGVYVVEHDDPAANLGRSVELEIFGEFFQNDEQLMKREYGPYEQNSTFIIVLDEQKGEPAGVMRLISNGQNGLKSLNDIGQPPWEKELDIIFQENDLNPEDLDHIWDIATLAVRKEYRGKTAVSAALYRALYLASEKRKIEYWVAILDNNVLELLAVLGIHFKRYEGVGPASYLGSPESTPVYGNKNEIADRLREDLPDAYAYLALGEGLAGEVDFRAIG